ncbi:hypothetical protein HPB50_029536 [Hyalomma asiaticum]|nr:hypothetical protein HPB50_029536 [Hyalomma asiaticum]
MVLITSHLHQTLSWSYTRKDTTWRDYSTGHTSDRSAQTSPAATPAIPPVTVAPGPESGAIPKVPPEPRYNLIRTFQPSCRTPLTDWTKSKQATFLLTTCLQCRGIF